MSLEEFADSIILVANRIRQGLVNGGWAEGNAMALAQSSVERLIDSQLEVEDFPLDERN